MHGCLAALIGVVKRALEIILLKFEQNEFKCGGDCSLELFGSQALCKYIILIMHLKPLTCSLLVTCHQWCCVSPQVHSMDVCLFLHLGKEWKGSVCFVCFCPGSRYFNLNICSDFSFILRNFSTQIFCLFFFFLFFFGGDDRNYYINFSTKTKSCTQKFSGKAAEHIFF